MHNIKKRIDLMFTFVMGAFLFQWKRFMKCDGRPDPTSVKEINTFIALTKDKGKTDINVVLDDAKLILSVSTDP